MNKISALILAGGLGTRMKSEKPKVLHEISGASLLEHVTLNLKDAKVNDTAIVVGYKQELIRERLGSGFSYFYQEKQLGTGHAVMMAKDFLKDREGKILILCGDAPLLMGEELINFINYSFDNNLDLAVLTALLDDPASYGRIVRDENNKFKKIVELKDASKEEAKIKEVNSGAYLFDCKKLYDNLDSLTTNNAQKEYYLTDMIEIFLNNNFSVDAYTSKDPRVLMAVNDRYQLSQCAKIMKDIINKKHMLNGVTIIDSDSTYIDRKAIIGKDTIIYPNTIISGESAIGNECTIYSSRIENSIIKDNCKIDTSTIIESSVEENVKIGPYSHLRPKSNICNDVKLGNFVEVKNSTINKGSKVSHLTYVGDGVIGENTNVGCGVVFVNYDGDKKHLTQIGDNCFIGCNVNLVAPVKIGNGTYVAAGSTITEDVEDNALVIARSKQSVKPDWKKK